MANTIRRYIPFTEKIDEANSLDKETVIAMIIMLYKNRKAIVHSPDGNTNFFNIIAVVSEGDTLTPYLFIICQDYVLLTLIDLMKENSLTLKRARY